MKLTTFKVRSYLEPMRIDDATAATGEARLVNPPMFSLRNEAQRNEASHPRVICEEPEILPGIHDHMPGRGSQPRAPTARGSSLGLRKSRTVDETVRCKADDEFRPGPLKRARTDTTDVLTAATVRDWRDYKVSFWLRRWSKCSLLQGSMEASDEVE